jgi:hypothetical protein
MESIEYVEVYDRRMGSDGRHGDEPPMIQYWHSEEIPPYLLETLASFREHHPALPHLLFSEAGAEALIEERFGSRELAAFRACAAPSMQSDYFRYCAVLALGGLYADAGLRCLGSMRPLIVPEEGRLFKRSLGDVIRYHRPPTVTQSGITAFRRPTEEVYNGIFAFGSPGHPFLRLALEAATASIESRSSENVWGTTGPAIFTALVLLRKAGSFDAFLREVGDGRGIWRPEVICEAVGDYARVPAALEGVRVDDINELSAQMSYGGGSNPYKRSEMHWLNWKRSIYR